MGTAPDDDIRRAVKDVNAVESQMRAKQRHGGYGGLGQQRLDPRISFPAAQPIKVEVEGKGEGKVTTEYYQMILWRKG